MNKRLLGFVMILAIAISGAFAAPLLQIGPTVFYHQQVWDAEDKEVILPESFGDVTNNIGLGADVRINLGMLQVAAFADCGMPFGKDITVLTMNGGVSLNTVISLAFLDAFIGAGAHVDVEHNFDSGAWAFNGAEYSSMTELLSSSSLFYRAGASINLGFLGLSVFADIPVDGSVKSLSLEPLFGETKVSASLLFNIG